MNELSQFFLQLLVQVKRTVKETAASTSGTIFVESLLGFSYNAFVARKACVGVRAEHKNMMAVHLDLSTLLACDSTKIRIDSQLSVLLRTAIALVSFL